MQILYEDNHLIFALKPAGLLAQGDITGDANIYPTPEVKAKMSPNLARSQEFTRELNRTWTRFRTGK